MTMTTDISVLDAQDEDIQAISPANAVLWRRLGLEALPAHETRWLPTARLVVAGADQLMRSAKRLLKSIQHVGILQPPSVVVQGDSDLHDSEATFEVIARRRRVLAARLAGLSVIKCEVYAATTLPLSALLALIENEQRSAAWVREVEALRCLIDEGVGMTLDDLAAFGFDRSTLSERLKIAQLPAPLLARVLAGDVSREVARKLVRLTQTQQERIASLAEGGEEITAERVKELLRAQINAGFAPVQAALAQEGWEPSQPAYLSAQSGTAPHAGGQIPLQEEQAVQAERRRENSPPERGSTVSSGMLSLLDTLQAFEQSPDFQAVAPPVKMLSQALAQQLRLALREAASSSADPNLTVYHEFR